MRTYYRIEFKAPDSTFYCQMNVEDRRGTVEAARERAISKRMAFWINHSRESSI